MIVLINHRGLMAKIFISYSSKDRPIVNELAEDLIHLFDHQVWYDQELKRSGGQSWWNLICEQIRQCEVFLYALSPQVLKSEPCKREYGYAVALGKPVLPLIVTEVDYRYLPIELQAAQLVDFRQRTRDQQRALRLSISNLPSPPPLPPDALQLAPPAPLDPVGVLLDRISKLTADPNLQRDLILDIEDLSDDAALANVAPEILSRLLERDDVLTGRNIKRAEELLAKLAADIAGRDSSPPHDVPAPLSMASVLATVHEMLSAPPPAEPAAGTRKVDDYGIPMVYVPAGKFLMGSKPGEGDTNEQPQHEQIITAGFWLDLTPVTNESYARFIAGGGYRNPDYWTEAGWNWVQSNQKTGPKDYENFTVPQQPRVGVTWYEAFAYCSWRGGRLPTEAEWEWAARGENTRSFYPWGGAWDAAKLNSGYSDETHPTIGTTTPVGMFSPAGDAPLGHGEMLGQVFEWMNSAFRPYPYDAHDGREDRYAPEMRVRRGGSWLDGKFAHRVTTRYYFPQHYSDKTDGFRLAAGGDALPLPPRPPYDLVVYGRTTFCPDLLHTIRWLHAWNVPYRQLQLDRDEEVALRLDAWLGARTIPTLVVAAWGDVLPITPPTGVDFSHLRNTDRGAMLHEPDESTLRAFLVRHGFLT